MNKTDIINAMAEKAGFSKNDAKKALDSFMDAIQEGLAKGEKISIVGFGTFEVAQREARIAKNPRTGETINVPARKVVKFKVGSQLGNIE